MHVGVVAVDGTKLAANAAPEATRDFEQIARESLAEADAVDAEEDARFGDARGDELPPELSTAQGRRGWLRDAKRRLEDKRAAEARPISSERGERLSNQRSLIALGADPPGGDMYARALVVRGASMRTADRDVCRQRLPDPAIGLGWPVFAMSRACVAGIFLS